MLNHVPVVISVPTAAVQVSPGQLDYESYIVIGPFQPQYVTSFSQILLSAWEEMLIHQTPSCFLCLPCAAIICFGTADLWTVSRHTVIFLSNSTKKGKHINYSKLKAALIYPARNRIFFVCI